MVQVYCMQYMLVYMCGHMDWVFVTPNFVLFNCPSNSVPPDEGYGDLTVERQFSGGCSECCVGRWEWGWWTTPYFHLQEKRKVRKALDQQRKAEAQLQVEAERCACVLDHTLPVSLPPCPPTGWLACSRKWPPCVPK